MPTLRISKRVVDALKPGTSDQYVWDTDIPGFGIRMKPSGAAAYIYQYRSGGGRTGTTRRVTLAKVGVATTAEQARGLAKAKHREVLNGGDPAVEKQLAKSELTVAGLADLYLEEGCELKKPRTILNDRSRIERHIKPLLGARRISTVTAADVAKAMRDVAAGKTAIDQKTGKHGRAIVTGGKGAAKQVVALLSAIFAFAVAQKLIKENPARGVKTYRTTSGERFLTTEELGRLGDAIREAETVGIPWEPDPAKQTKHAPKPEQRRAMLAPSAAAALRLLILTGARLREILHLEWEHVDLERGMLHLPDSKTGRKTIFINAPALAVLAGLPRVGTFVIPGEPARTSRKIGSGPSDDADELPDYDRPRADLKRPWQLVSKRAGLGGVRLHDLRHTNASIGAAAGLGLPIIGKLLGHSQVGTTARYAHLADDPLRRAADVIGGRIAAAMGDAGPERAGEVVELRRR